MMKYGEMYWDENEKDSDDMSEPDPDLVHQSGGGSNTPLNSSGREKLPSFKSQGQTSR